MAKEKKPLSKGKKIGIGVAAALAAAAVVGIGVFYCTFFPNPLAKRIAPVDISAGEMSVTGESNVLIAYFSIANNRAYPDGEVDAVASASLAIREGKGYGHAELYALAAQEATGGDLFPIKTAEPYLPRARNSSTRAMNSVCPIPLPVTQTKVPFRSHWAL